MKSNSERKEKLEVPIKVLLDLVPLIKKTPLKTNKIIEGAFDNANIDMFLFNIYIWSFGIFKGTSSKSLFNTNVFERVGYF